MRDLHNILTGFKQHLGEFLGHWDWLWCPGLPPVLVSIAFPFAFHISVFFHSLFAFHISVFFHSLLISFVFFLYGQRICTHLAWLWNLMLWSQRRIRGVHGAEILIQISALAGVEPLNIKSSGRERYN